MTTYKELQDWEREIIDKQIENCKDDFTKEKAIIEIDIIYKTITEMFDDLLDETQTESIIDLIKMIDKDRDRLRQMKSNINRGHFIKHNIIRDTLVILRNSKIYNTRCIKLIGY